MLRDPTLPSQRENLSVMLKLFVIRGDELMQLQHQNIIKPPILISSNENNAMTPYQNCRYPKKIQSLASNTTYKSYLLQTHMFNFTKTEQKKLNGNGNRKTREQAVGKKEAPFRPGGGRSRHGPSPLTARIRTPRTSSQSTSPPSPSPLRPQPPPPPIGVERGVDR